MSVLVGLDIVTQGNWNPTCTSALTISSVLQGEGLQDF